MEASPSVSQGASQRGWSDLKVGDVIEGYMDPFTPSPDETPPRGPNGIDPEDVIWRWCVELMAEKVESHTPMSVMDRLQHNHSRMLTDLLPHLQFPKTWVNKPQHP